MILLIMGFIGTNYSSIFLGLLFDIQSDRWLQTLWPFFIFFIIFIIVFHFSLVRINFGFQDGFPSIRMFVHEMLIRLHVRLEFLGTYGALPVGFVRDFGLPMAE